MLLNENPDAVIVTEPDGKVAHWSQGAQAVFGYAKEEAVGQHLANLTIPADQLEAEARARRDAAEFGISTYEAIRKRKDGSLIYADIITKPIKDPDGNVQFFLSNKRDVTQLKALRDAKLVETRFRDLLESTPDAIVIVNPMGRIVLSNSQAERLFGYERGDLTGKLVDILLPGRFRGSHLSHRSFYFEQPRARAMGAGLELYGLKKDGTEFPVEISLSPLKTEENMLVMSAIRDISDRKKIERVLSEQNIELQNAAAAKNQFLASMSHELRTPLNGIIGFSEFLIDEKPGPLNAEQKEYLNDILTSGNHLLHLINDVLDLAKVESGKMELHIEQFKLSNAITEVASVVAPMIRTKDLTLEIKLADDLDLVRTDQQKLKQVLYNLLSNASKFTETGGTVKVSATRSENNMFQIEVRDTGIGIKKEDLEKLFIEFQQLNTGANRRYQGSGLGLALTRRMLALMKGTVHVESQPGMGSSFTIILPMEFDNP
ncbi:MAG: PAS domain S-box protein [Spirochaetia bacterium]|nr:PAS domain S-box protein [Spirochaetia bacterium]